MYKAVYRKIEEIASSLQQVDPGLAELFRGCYPNTLETTVELLDDDTSFVITGDIPAMWLRDSSAQIRPYVDLAGEDEDLRRLIRGVVHRQARYLALDPYANAFNKEPNGNGHRETVRRRGLWAWERKFELDSLCYPVQLCAQYWQATGDRSVFNEDVHRMFAAIVDVMKTEQRHDPIRATRSNAPTVRPRIRCRSKAGERGPILPEWSGPASVRATTPARTAISIPSNMFAVVVLKQSGRLGRGNVRGFRLVRKRFQSCGGDRVRHRNLRQGHHPEYGTIYAYETDGFGNYII